MMQQRICSSFASGMATALRLLEKRKIIPVEGEDDAAQLPLGDLPEILDSERFHLEKNRVGPRKQAHRPKLEAVLYFH